MIRNVQLQLRECLQRKIAAHKPNKSTEREANEIEIESLLFIRDAFSWIPFTVPEMLCVGRLYYSVCWQFDAGANQSALVTTYTSLMSINESRDW